MTEYNKGYQQALSDIKKTLYVQHKSVLDWSDTQFRGNALKNLIATIIEPIFDNLMMETNNLAKSKQEKI